MTDFNAAVAERAKVDTRTVAEVLDRHQVHHWAAPPAAPRMTIRRVRFAGVNASSERYDFKWEPDTGVWAIATVSNNVGKSSVLDVIRWLISGRDRIDKDVRPMIDEAELLLDLVDAGERRHELRVHATGQPDQVRGVVGFDGETIATFDDTSFEDVMDRVLLPRLGLEYLTRWQKYTGSEDGRATQRRWTSLLPAFFVPKADAEALLGSTRYDSGMLLQVYLGMPWYSTDREADVALNALGQARRDADRRSTRDAAEIERRSTVIAEKIAAAQDRLRRLPDTAAADAELRRTSRALTSCLSAHERAVAVRAQRERDEASSRLSARDAARHVRVARETLSARGLFGELRVEICPHCDQHITDDRREAEVASQVCMVCTRPGGTADVDAKQVLADAEARLQQAEAGAEIAASAAGQARRAEGDARAELGHAQAARSAALPSETLLERRVVERVEIARLEGERAALLRERVDADDDEQTKVDRKVLRRVRDEAKERMDNAKLMDRLGKEAAELCVQFGMTRVTGVAVDRASHVAVSTESSTRSFKDLKATEKLRVRVAVVIALLRIARPIRHPGLLIIDSPADGELADENLAAMLRAVQDVCLHEPRLQVLIATTRTSQIAEAVPQERIVFRAHGEFLF